MGNPGTYLFESDSEQPSHDKARDESPALTLRGVIEKILPGLGANAPEKVQIMIEGADHLYRELRFGNTLKDSSGKLVTLRQWAFEGVPFPLARIDVGHIVGKEPWEHTIWVEREYLEVVDRRVLTVNA